ncbi:helix-turn-helix domain-containing protein [Rhodoligotrophos ferricapiens]|uniref:helix-turn-helix domain-containing protein n=1 Tax=Rhodoligotrophos ferricapiens TaxID=3069264 RepID=UPI00315CA857
MNKKVETRGPNGKIDAAIRLVELDSLLGQRIRHRRRAIGLSLRELAERSGISIGLLSQIERGLSSPSVRVVAALADALSLSLGNLFTEESPTPTKSESSTVTRAHSRKKLAFWRTGISKELVTPQTDNPGLDIFIVVIEPGGTTGEQVYTHAGEEGGLVLEGELEITISGETYRLNRGDGFRFESMKPHSFRNPGKGTTRVLWVNSPHSHNE